MALSSGLSELWNRASKGCSVGFSAVLPPFSVALMFSLIICKRSKQLKKSTSLSFFSQTLGYNKCERHPHKNYCFGGNSQHEAKKKMTMRQRRDETQAVFQITCFSTEYLVSRARWCTKSAPTEKSATMEWTIIKNSECGTMDTSHPHHA